MVNDDINSTVRNMSRGTRPTTRPSVRPAILAPRPTVRAKPPSRTQRAREQQLIMQQEGEQVKHEAAVKTTEELVESGYFEDISTVQEYKQKFEAAPEESKQFLLTPQSVKDDQQVKVDNLYTEIDAKITENNKWLASDKAKFQRREQRSDDTFDKLKKKLNKGKISKDRYESFVEREKLKIREYENELEEKETYRTEYNKKLQESRDKININITPDWKDVHNEAFSWADFQRTKEGNRNQISEANYKEQIQIEKLTNLGYERTPTIVTRVDQPDKITGTISYYNPDKKDFVTVDKFSYDKREFTDPNKLYQRKAQVTIPIEVGGKTFEMKQFSNVYITDQPGVFRTEYEGINVGSQQIDISSPYTQKVAGLQSAGKTKLPVIIPRSEIQEGDVVKAPKQIEELGYKDLPSNQTIVEREVDVFYDTAKQTYVTKEGITVGVVETLAPERKGGVSTTVEGIFGVPESKAQQVFDFKTLPEGVKIGPDGLPMSIEPDKAKTPEQLREEAVQKELLSRTGVHGTLANISDLAKGTFANIFGLGYIKPTTDVTQAEITKEDYGDIVKEAYDEKFKESPIEYSEGWINRQDKGFLPTLYNTILNAGYFKRNGGKSEIFISNINKLSPFSTIADTKAHEFGHFIYSDKKMIDSAKYDTEDFANSFSKYIDDPKKFKKMFPEKTREFEIALDITEKEVLASSTEIKPGRASIFQPEREPVEIFKQKAILEAEEREAKGDAGYIYQVSKNLGTAGDLYKDIGKSVSVVGAGAVGIGVAGTVVVGGITSGAFEEMLAVGSGIDWLAKRTGLKEYYKTHPAAAKRVRRATNPIDFWATELGLKEHYRTHPERAKKIQKAAFNPIDFWATELGMKEYYRTHPDEAKRVRSAVNPAKFWYKELGVTKYKAATKTVTSEYSKTVQFVTAPLVDSFVRDARTLATIPFVTKPVQEHLLEHRKDILAAPLKPVAYVGEGVARGRDIIHEKVREEFIPAVSTTEVGAEFYSGQERALLDTTKRNELDRLLKKGEDQKIFELSEDLRQLNRAREEGRLTDELYEQGVDKLFGGDVSQKDYERFSRDYETYQRTWGKFITKKERFQELAAAGAFTKEQELGGDIYYSLKPLAPVIAGGLLTAYPATAPLGQAILYSYGGIKILSGTEKMLAPDARLTTKISGGIEAGTGALIAGGPLLGKYVFTSRAAPAKLLTRPEALIKSLKIGSISGGISGGLVGVDVYSGTKDAKRAVKAGVVAGVGVGLLTTAVTYPRFARVGQKTLQSYEELPKPALAKTHLKGGKIISGGVSKSFRGQWSIKPGTTYIAKGKQYEAGSNLFIDPKTGKLFTYSPTQYGIQQFKAEKLGKGYVTKVTSRGIFHDKTIYTSEYHKITSKGKIDRLTSQLIKQGYDPIKTREALSTYYKAMERIPGAKGAYSFTVSPQGESGENILRLSAAMKKTEILKFAKQYPDLIQTSKIRYEFTPNVRPVEGVFFKPQHVPKALQKFGALSADKIYINEVLQITYDFKHPARSLIERYSETVSKKDYDYGRLIKDIQQGKVADKTISFGRVGEKTEVGVKIESLPGGTAKITPFKSQTKLLYDPIKFREDLASKGIGAKEFKTGYVKYTPFKTKDPLKAVDIVKSLRQDVSSTRIFTSKTGKVTGLKGYEFTKKATGPELRNVKILLGDKKIGEGYSEIYKTRKLSAGYVESLDLKVDKFGSITYTPKEEAQRFAFDKVVKNIGKNFKLRALKRFLPKFPTLLRPHETITTTTPEGQLLESQFYGRGKVTDTLPPVGPLSFPQLQPTLAPQLAPSITRALPGFQPTPLIHQPTPNLDILIADLLASKLEQPFQQQIKLATVQELAQYSDLAQVQNLVLKIEQQQQQEQDLQQELQQATDTGVGITTPVPRTPTPTPTPIPRPTPTPPPRPLRTPRIVPIVFPWFDAEAKKVAKGKKKKKNIFALTPDFTARALGITPEQLQKEAAVTEAKKVKTGAEIRTGVEIVDQIESNNMF